VVGGRGVLLCPGCIRGLGRGLVCSLVSGLVSGLVIGLVSAAPRFRSVGKRR
jgi:hypothetical protein